jgi:hypothetical protein
LFILPENSNNQVCFKDPIIQIPNPINKHPIALNNGLSVLQEEDEKVKWSDV